MNQSKEQIILHILQVFSEKWSCLLWSCGCDSLCVVKWAVPQHIWCDLWRLFLSTKSPGDLHHCGFTSLWLAQFLRYVRCNLASFFSLRNLPSCPPTAAGFVKHGGRGGRRTPVRATDWNQFKMVYWWGCAVKAGCLDDVIVDWNKK